MSGSGPKNSRSDIPDHTCDIHKSGKLFRLPRSDADVTPLTERCSLGPDTFVRQPGISS